jgi:hypothetical protein
MFPTESASAAVSETIWPEHEKHYTRNQQGIDVSTYIDSKACTVVEQGVMKQFLNQDHAS